MTQVWKEQNTSGSERLVLLALADIANDDGVCWPSMTTLARKCNLSRRYIIDMLASLEQRKYIQRSKRRDAAGDPTSNIYRLNSGNWVVNPASPPSASRITTGSEADITTGSEPCLTTVVNPASLKPSFNHHIESSIESSLFEKLSTAFEQATGILFHNPPKWNKAIQELEKLGATPELIQEAVNASREGGYPIVGPWSIANSVRICISKYKKTTPHKVASTPIVVEPGWHP